MFLVPYKPTENDLFSYLIGVIRRTETFLIYTSAASIIVGGKRAQPACWRQVGKTFTEVDLN